MTSSFDQFPPGTWIVTLQGDVNSEGKVIPLEVLKSFDLPAQTKIDYCDEENTYFLVSEVFNHLLTAKDVWLAARERLMLITSAYVISGGGILPGAERITVGAVYQITDNGRTALAPGAGVTSYAWTENDVNLDSLKLIISFAGSCGHLATAAEILGQPMPGWHQLYRTLDDIEYVLGCKVSDPGLKFCSVNERASFTRACNTYQLAGRDARHGERGFLPPSNPMNHQGAIKFARDLFVKTLKHISSSRTSRA